MKKLLAVLALAVAGSTAQANVIVTPFSAPANGVAYLNFDFDGGLFGLSFLNALTITGSDPEIFLFAGNVAAGTLLGTDDDGGPAFESSLTRLLGAGSYVLAIGRFDLTLSEAVSGSNPGASALSGDVRLSSITGTITVPEPATLGLLGLGILGAGLFGRRKRLA